MVLRFAVVALGSSWLITILTLALEFNSITNTTLHKGSYPFICSCFIHATLLTCMMLQILFQVKITISWHLFYVAYVFYINTA